MYKDTLEAERDLLAEAETRDESGSDDVTRRLLRAVETYKAGCMAEGEEPSVEDSWLVLLSALHLEDGK